MKTKPAYLVIDTTGRAPTITRCRQSWPSLEPGEIVVRVSLVIPDELVPQINEVEVEDLDALAIAVESEAL